MHEKHEKYSAKGVLELFCILIMIKMVISRNLYQLMQQRYSYGRLIAENTRKGQTVQACTLSCLAKNTNSNSCKGFAFSTNEDIHSRCMYIIDGTTHIDLKNTTWNGYEFYSLVSPLSLAQQRFPGSRLYFPLDSDTGTRHGPDPDNVAFIGEGIVGNAFYNPISDEVRSYYRLGHYNASDYCFPVPPWCPLGVTISFWAKILNETNNAQGILTTKPTNGQGLVIRWKNVQGIKILIQRDFDNKEEMLTVSHDKFLANYGYAVWVHYVLAYRFNESSLENNINLYLNGVVRPDSEKSMRPWTGDTPGHDGGLELAHTRLGRNGEYGSIMVDELVIWEEMLTHAEIVALYHTYL